MNSFFHLLGLIIANTLNESTGAKPALKLAGVASDFDPRVLSILVSAAAGLCVINFLSLQRHQISREQLRCGRIYQILRQHRSVVTFMVPAWLKTLNHLLCKIGFITVVYLLTSAQDARLVWMGAFATFVFIVQNTWLLLREVLNPRSTFHRRYLMHRIDPMFLRVRLFFDLGRRFLYFMVVSYSIHRLHSGMFAVESPQVSLFVLHLQSTLTGMTSLGTDPLVPTHTFSASLQVLRSIFSFLVFLTFANLIASGLSSSTSPKKRSKMRDVWSASAKGLNTKNDTKALVDLVIEQYLEIPAKRIKLDSDLVRDFNASPVEMAGLQVMFEDAFEVKLPSTIDFRSKTTVGDIVDFFWEQTRQETNQLAFAHLCNHAK